MTPTGGVPIATHREGDAILKKTVGSTRLLTAVGSSRDMTPSQTATTSRSRSLSTSHSAMQSIESLLSCASRSAIFAPTQSLPPTCPSPRAAARPARSLGCPAFAVIQSLLPPGPQVSGIRSCGFASGRACSAGVVCGETMRATGEGLMCAAPMCESRPADVFDLGELGRLVSSLSRPRCSVSATQTSDSDRRA